MEDPSVRDDVVEKSTQYILTVITGGARMSASIYFFLLSSLFVWHFNKHLTSTPHAAVGDELFAPRRTPRSRASHNHFLRLSKPSYLSTTVVVAAVVLSLLLPLHCTAWRAEHMAATQVLVARSGGHRRLPGTWSGGTPQAWSSAMSSTTTPRGDGADQR